MTGLAAIVFSGRDWLLPVLALTFVLAAALVWAGLRGDANARIRFGCALLKLLGVLTLGACLLEPLRVGQRAKPGANDFAIIADNSQSMTIKDAGRAQSRGEALRQELADDPQKWQAALAENFQLRRYMFDSRLRDVRDFGELNFTGAGTAIVGALRAAAERWRGQPVAGVLLFTDGNATEDLADLSALDGCPPIYPVVIGQETGLRDIALEKLSVSQTAFEDAPVTFQAEAAAHGFAGDTVTARLTEIGAGEPRVVAEQQQSGKSDEARLNFRFQIQPGKPGLHFYQLEARARGGAAEATLVNNRKLAVVDRGQETFRVLYVGGRPNWEYKFLNRALEEDPQVQVVSLIRVARREPKFDFKGRSGESSNPLFRGFGDTNEETARYDQPVLIRLNTKDELELRGGFPKTAEDLFRYHAVIVGDVEAEFFTHDQVALLQRFVSERGGGFLMLGGAESFREGKYAGTVIASMLPVYMDDTASLKSAKNWKFSLTREGWLEPWTRLRETEADERARLESLPAFAVLNSARGVKPGARTLATVSDADGNAYPALAVERYGLGRTAAMMIGDLWRWGFQDESAQKDLAKSWRQLVRWLVSDTPPRVAVAAQTSADGDPTRVRIVVTARDEAFKPLENATVQLTVRRVAGAGPSTNYVQLTADASAAQPGAYEATYVAREAGAYSVDAKVTEAGGKSAGQSAAGWALDPAADEFRSLKPNRALLESIARRTGGSVLAMDDLGRFARRAAQRPAPISETWSRPLWHTPTVFAFALACLLADWGVRRWKGLP